MEYFSRKSPGGLLKDSNVSLKSFEHSKAGHRRIFEEIFREISGESLEEFLEGFKHS